MRGVTTLLITGVVCMKINLSLSPLTNVLGLINGKNGSSIVETQVTVDSVIASTENPGDNTKITLTGIDGKGIEGSRAFFYGRYDLLGGKAPDPTRVEILATDTQSQILGKIATAYGLEPTEITFNGGSDVTIPATDDVAITTMAAKTDSLLYNGPAVKVNVTLPNAVVPLSKAIPVTEFDGMLNFGIDLTKSATLNFYAMVNAIFPWGFSTAAIQTSNLQPFTPTAPSTVNSVITLTALAGSGFSGTITLHYHRLDILQQVVSPPAKVTILAADTDAQVKAKICAAYNLIAASVQMSSTVRPTVGVDGSCTMRPPASSMIYTAAGYTIVLTL